MLLLNPYPGSHEAQIPVATAQTAHPTPPGALTSLHGVQAPAPARAYVFAGHVWHARSPAVEKVPAAHSATLLVEPVDEHAYPLGHVPQVTAPAEENDPRSH